MSYAARFVSRQTSRGRLGGELIHRSGVASWAVQRAISLLLGLTYVAEATTWRPRVSGAERVASAAVSPQPSRSSRRGPRMGDAERQPSPHSAVQTPRERPGSQPADPAPPTAQPDTNRPAEATEDLA
ncbi:hypothetical protein [Lentzea aerocolonigenes]|uniref:hypothetical protein n=1 Tax=Lentzea aerocolonigenes TaxID=68170 RepID=UPI0012E32A92|nr:hypothetical protein [Lentzea aerocolonigenes]